MSLSCHQATGMISKLSIIVYPELMWKDINCAFNCNLSLSAVPNCNYNRGVVSYIGPFKTLHVQLKLYKFLGSWLYLYAYTTTSFQLKLLISGDVNPNPGPSTCEHHHAVHQNCMPQPAEECMMYDPLFFDLRKLVQTYWIIGDSTIIQEKKNVDSCRLSHNHNSHMGKRAWRRKPQQIQVLTFVISTIKMVSIYAGSTKNI